jgi:hypothetical protein
VIKPNEIELNALYARSKKRVLEDRENNSAKILIFSSCSQRGLEAVAV